MLALPVGTAKSVRVDLIRVSMASEPIMSTGSRCTASRADSLVDWKLRRFYSYTATRANQTVS